MKCDICKENDAIIFVRQVINSTTRELYLCASCAEKRGISEDGSKIDFNLSGLLGNLINERNDSKNKVCPVCGKKLQTILKEKTVGCSECYNVFHDDIKGILKGFGVTRSYTGSLPNQIANFKSSLNDRVALQEKLNKAIQEENYEKAAVYRDKLKLLENQSIQEVNE